MSGIFPNEAVTVALQRIYNNVTTDRGNSLILGLFTNSSGLDEASVWADITQPTGGGYAEIALTDANWSVSGGIASYAQQLFTPTGDYTGDVYGYYIRTTGAATRLLAFEVSGIAQTILLADNKVYKVTPTVDLAGGINGITASEGIQVMLDMLFRNEYTDRGASIDLALDTNATDLTSSSVFADISKPAGGTYGDKILVDGTWIVSGVDATYATQSFDASGSDFTPDIEAYTMQSNGILWHYDPYSGAPITVADGDSYEVDLTIAGD